MERNLDLDRPAVLAAAHVLHDVLGEKSMGVRALRHHVTAPHLRRVYVEGSRRLRAEALIRSGWEETAESEGEGRIVRSLLAVEEQTRRAG